ncbi:hypothetical protein MHPYR_140115 [uncultured Mycobacterium sp.]|uniref:Uncharacterized protein n=1 Tax=uncultured Mycobacterium sp. TaxID=171292 RepID=A0A1Y5P1V5_9MYCO|nr:hypothetical protein MHPYR_140115 [uncultured Mycobacterium sp.]
MGASVAVDLAAAATAPNIKKKIRAARVRGTPADGAVQVPKWIWMTLYDLGGLGPRRRATGGAMSCAAAAGPDTDVF